eukprot:scaffold191142_cov30-Prasinocladus_malaysianus.AAC.3
MVCCCEGPGRVGELLGVKVANEAQCSPGRVCEEFPVRMANLCKCPSSVGKLLGVAFAQARSYGFCKTIHQLRLVNACPALCHAMSNVGQLPPSHLRAAGHYQ